MIAVDTNILLRYVLDDDQRHSPAARELIDETCTPGNPAFVHEVAVVELVWVLGRRKPVSKPHIAELVRSLANNPNLRFRDMGGLFAALDAWETGPANFGEYLIAAQSSNLGAAPTVTFDADAGKSPGFSLLPS